MITRAVRIVAAVIIIVGGLTSAAHAAYPPGGGGGTVVTTDKSNYTVGSSVVINATGFQACAGQLVTFTITPPGGGAPIVLTAIANADGTARVTLTAPSTLGLYTVVVSSPGCSDASTSFTVSQPSRLPQTGADTRSWLVTGVAVALIGLGFALVARRRRHPATAE